MRPILLTLLLATVAAAQPPEFKTPWADTSRPIIIDPYEENALDWDKLATDKRVVAIIHRGTIGFRADKKYAERKKEAQKRGYQWGSYHLGKKGEPVKQADFYLKTIAPKSDELIALDIEDLGGSNMSLEDAVKFAKRIKEKTGRYPLFYSNNHVAKTVSARYGTSSVFDEMPLWYARFRDNVPDFPAGTWKTYKLWQFACEINCAVCNGWDPVEKECKKYVCSREKTGCPYKVPGTSRCMDINIFYGTVEELKAEWPFT